MKKTLLALAVLAAAGSVNAATIYDKDGVTVDMGGAAEVQYMQGYTADSDPDLRLDDGELNFKTTVAVSDDLSAIGKFDFEFEGNEAQGNSESFENTELYAGLAGGFGTVTFGRQYTFLDDAGIGEDYELGTEQIGADWAHGSDVVKYKYEADMFYVGVAHDLGNDQNTDERTITDGVIGVVFEGIEARAYIYSAEETDLGVTTTEQDAYNIEVVYTADVFGVAGSFGNVETDGAEVDIIEFSGYYSMGSNKFAGGIVMADADSTDATVWYANVTHSLHSNANVYAEIGSSDVDDTEFGYLAGIEVKF